MPICPAEGCRQSILENQATLKLSPGTLLRGKKSGAFYHSATFEVEILIHYGCVFRFFHPQADADMFNEFYGLVEKDIKETTYDDLKQAAYAEASEDLTKLCADCLSDRQDPDKPPDEYSCSDCGSGALPICPDCGSVTDLVIEEEDLNAEPNRAYG